MVTPRLQRPEGHEITEEYLNGYEQGYSDARELIEKYPKKREDYIEIADGIFIYPKDQGDSIEYVDGHKINRRTIKSLHEEGWMLIWIAPDKRQKILNMLATLKEEK